ncbi:MAG: UDP-N-acetylmuramoyl-tripeptide--D-alanyl-D-alanine ligase [Gammaproteobacteria bacterium]
MIKMSFSEIANTLHCESPAQDIVFQGISTDTRTLLPGNLFVAIVGEQFDGHEFITEAFNKGASGAIVNRPIDSPIPQFIVEDTLTAFGKISALWRARFSLPVIGVTGSNGKTTLKNMIASILRAACNNDASQVLATEGNLNNHIGVPMMLCRLNDKHRYAVLEMGMNHFGEIEYLTHLAKPQIAIINNAAEAHLEALKNVAGVARAKGEIFLGLAKNGTAVLNLDDAHYQYWLSLVKNYKHLSFGFNESADIRAINSDNQPITIKTPKGNIEVNLPLLGKHNIANAVAATAVAIALDIDLNAIKMGLEQVQPAPGRMRQYTLSNGTRIIDDTYNANPFSLQAAVNTLAQFPGERVLVVGDMKELGPNAKELHFAAGEKIRAAGIEYLFTYGEMSAAATERFGNNAQHFTDRQQLISALQPHLKENTTILIKGSRSMHMEKIVAGIIPENQLEHSH